MAATSEKLLPCPFCGGAAKLIEWDSHDGRDSYNGVMCDNRECMVEPHFDSASGGDAVERWNRRAP
jgi:Lar family restriction alleviation protein